MSKFLAVVRCSCGVAWWGLLDLLLVAFAVVIVFANYAGLRSAFALMGLDLTPLSEDPLLGGVFDAFGIGEATQADLYAGALAATVTSGEIWACHWVLRLLSLWRDRDHYRGQGEVIAGRYRGAIEWAAVMALLGLVLLAGAVYWDLELFRLRAVMGSLGLDRPEQLWELQDWKALVSMPDAPYAVRLAWVTPIGYVCATAVAALELELAGLRTLDAMARWQQSVVDLFAFDRDPDAMVPTAPDVEPRHAIEEPVGLASADDPMGGAARRIASVAASLATAAPVEVPTPGPVVGPSTPATAPTAVESELAVLGGQAGDRVALAEALANPDRYVVDVESRRVWDRAYYEALHGAVTSQPPANQAA